MTKLTAAVPSAQFTAAVPSAQFTAAVPSAQFTAAPSNPWVRGDVEVERIQLDGSAWVDVARGWLDNAAEVFEALHSGVAWQPSRLFRYDHWVEERRLGAMWRTGLPMPHPALLEATRSIRRRYRADFTSFGMIHYRDGRDGQAFHRDTDMRWLDDTVVAILTLGARRPWLLRPLSAKHTDAPGKGAIHDLSPGPGDLIVMGGSCQRDWQHSVAYQTTRTIGPRISIQWRHARRTGRPYQGASYRAPLTYNR